MSNPSNPDHLLELESERDSEHSSEHSQPRGIPPRERRAAARERRNRNRDREERRDRRRVPRDIKLKSVPLHLQLTDPISQYGRWYFHMKGYLITQDPNYKLLFEGGGEDNNLYHYQWSLARPITALVVDSDAAYVQVGLADMRTAPARQPWLVWLIPISMTLWITLSASRQNCIALFSRATL